MSTEDAVAYGLIDTMLTKRPDPNADEAIKSDSDVAKDAPKASE